MNPVALDVLFPSGWRKSENLTVVQIVEALVPGINIMILKQLPFLHLKRVCLIIKPIFK